MINSLLAVTGTFANVVKIISLILLAICAITLIVVVLMQNISGNGTNAISGMSESYYAQNKGRSKDNILKILTIVSSSVIAVLSIVLIILIK